MQLLTPGVRQLKLGNLVGKTSLESHLYLSVPFAFFHVIIHVKCVDKERHTECLEYRETERSDPLKLTDSPREGNKWSVLLCFIQPIAFGVSQKCTSLTCAVAGNDGQVGNTLTFDPWVCLDAAVLTVERKCLMSCTFLDHASLYYWYLCIFSESIKYICSLGVEF